jgi:NodT family efflux transporter outer membrane factor (OMF) lipoprotein
MKSHLLRLALCLTLTGCMVGPDYHRPQLVVPAAYKEASGWVPARPSDAAPKGDWWTLYDDPVLNRLEPMVAVSNQTLAADYAAYEQAYELVQEARGSLFPSLGLTGSATRQGDGAGSSQFTTGATTSSAANGTTTGIGGGGPRNSGTFEGSVSWTPDIWGKIRRQIQSDVSAAQVSAADLANATLSAQALLASDYIDLRAADAQAALYRQTVAADQSSLTITQNQADAGIVPPSDVLTARTQLDGAEAALIGSAEARTQFEHAIAVLTGRPPSALSLAPGPLMANVPVAPVGVPSLLLQRRPDIAAAERSMAEANAQVGVAVGAYYPDLSLSAVGGYSADPIGALFSVSNALWSLGTNATATLFEGGTRSATVAAAQFAYDESVANYRQTVLTAFQNVEDDLSNLRILAEQAGAEQAAVRDATRAVQIALNEYQAGTEDYTTVVSAQLTLLGDQQNALTVQQDRLLSSVALIQDLGGGFDDSKLPNTAALQQTLPFAP